MFDIFSALVFVIFLVAFGFIIFVIIRNVAQWNKNNHSPKLIVDAEVVAKRLQVSTTHNHTGNGMMHVSETTYYYATFQVESGDRIEFHVNGTQYGNLAEGDRGKLTFQGTRFITFERI